MAHNHYQQVPFPNFFPVFDHSGAGVDHPAPSFPFGPQVGGSPFNRRGFFEGTPGFGPWQYGRGGPWGPAPHHPDTEGPQEAGHTSSSGEHQEHEGREDSQRGRRGQRGFGCRGGRGGHQHRSSHGHRGPPPAFEAGWTSDLNALLGSLSTHPWAQTLRAFAEQAARRSGEGPVAEDADSEDSFTPPIDVFCTETHYVLHVALPGAKKEDVGINWDAEKGVLNLAGVVYRQGDEEFLKSLKTSERRVGVFERAVKLPPGDSDDKGEIDGDAITAKLEDGVLVVTVPKVEKEWTEVKRVDIE